MPSNFTRNTSFCTANKPVFSTCTHAHKSRTICCRPRFQCDGTHAQKPDFVFLRNGRVHLNRRGRQFSRLLAAEVCASAVVMLDTPWSEVVWRVLATHSIRQFPLHFPSRASPCAITFQLDSNTVRCVNPYRRRNAVRENTTERCVKWDLHKTDPSEGAHRISCVFPEEVGRVYFRSVVF